MQVLGKPFSDHRKLVRVLRRLLRAANEGGADWRTHAPRLPSDERIEEAGGDEDGGKGDGAKGKGDGGGADGENDEAYPKFVRVGAAGVGLPWADEATLPSELPCVDGGGAAAQYDDDTLAELRGYLREQLDEACACLDRTLTLTRNVKSSAGGGGGG